MLDRNALRDDARVLKFCMHEQKHGLRDVFPSTSVNTWRNNGTTTHDSDDSGDFKTRQYGVQSKERYKLAVEVQQPTRFAGGTKSCALTPAIFIQ